MYQNVQEYLQNERAQAARRQAEEAAERAARDEQEKRKIMMHEGLFQKVYSETQSPEFPSFDSEQNKYYKLELLPVTDEEFAEIKRFYLFKLSDRTASTAPQSDVEEAFRIYEHVGRAVKIMSLVCFVLFALISFISGALLLNELGLRALLVMFGGTLLAWIVCILAFAFGQLVENSDKLVALKQREKSEQNASEAHEQAPDAKTLN